jgi:hypothetical protein
MLDNRRMAMVEDENARTYRPLFVLYQAAVMKYADEPAVASQRTDARPSVVATNEAQ